MRYDANFKTSQLIYGTLTLGPLQKNLSIADGSNCILHAYESGINTFDTAQYYKTYPYLREVVKKDPTVIISSKSYAYDTVTATRAVEECMREIGRDYIDFFLMHEQESEHTLRGHKEALDTYLEYQRKGYIGHLGVSTHCIAGVKGMLRYPELEILHPMINKIGMGIVDGGREEMERVLQIAHQQGRFIYGMKLLAGGNLIQERESALDYGLSLPFLDGVALGMSSNEEIDYNVAYCEGDRAAAEKAGAQIKSKELFIERWCIGCGECVSRCQQGALSVSDGQCEVDRHKCVLCGYCAPACPEFAIKVI